LSEKEVKNVSKKRKENKEEFTGYDKRNIGLADVGRIDQDSPLWAQLSKGDKEKRLAAIQKKKQKLHKPKFSSFHRETVGAQPAKNADEALLRHMFASGHSSRLKQAVVMKDESGVSKGYGFVEFKKHEEALKVRSLFFGLPFENYFMKGSSSCQQQSSVFWR
jgi:RNA recognition motif-containing protein